MNIFWDFGRFPPGLIVKFTHCGFERGARQDVQPKEPHLEAELNTK